MGDQHLTDIISNVRAIGVILEKLSLQSQDVYPKRSPVDAPSIENDSLEFVTAFIGRLSALDKEIEASGSGRPMSRAGENALDKLRKGIHQAGTSLGLAGRQEVAVGQKSSLLFQRKNRHLDDSEDFFSALEDEESNEILLINTALLSSKATVPSNGGHRRTSSWFGWSKAAGSMRKGSESSSPDVLKGKIARFGRSNSDGEITAGLLHQDVGGKKSPGKSISKSERTAGGLLRRLACCLRPRGGSQVSSISYTQDAAQDVQKLGSHFLAKLQYWDRELARLRDQAVTCGAFSRKSQLTEICTGLGLKNTPPTYVRVKRLADLMLQTLRSGPHKVVLLHGMFGMGKSLLALDIALELENGLDYPGGVYYLHFGERFGAQCDEAELDTKIIEQQKLLIMLMAYDGEKVSETPGVSKADTTQLLASRLSGKRSLLIMDEVWSPKIVEKFLFPGHKGKILVTSSLGLTGSMLTDDNIRTQCVGSAGVSSCTLIQIGSDDYYGKQVDHRILESCSWTTIDLDRKESATKILETCGGCPLAVSIIGGMLRGKDATAWANMSADLQILLEGLTKKVSESGATTTSTDADTSFYSVSMTLKDEVRGVADGSFLSMRKSNFSDPSLQCFDVNSYSAASNLKDDVRFVTEGSFLSMRSNFSDPFLNNLGVPTKTGSWRIDSFRISDHGIKVAPAPEQNVEPWVIEPKRLPGPDPHSVLIGVIDLCLSRLPTEQQEAIKAMSLFESECLIPAPVVELALEVTGGKLASQFPQLMGHLVQLGVVCHNGDKNFFWVHSMVARFLARYRADIGTSVLQVHLGHLSSDMTIERSRGPKIRLLNSFLLSYGHGDLRKILVKQLGLESSVLGGVMEDVQQMAFSICTEEGRLPILEPEQQADMVLAATLRQSGNLRTSLGDLKGALAELNRSYKLKPDHVLTLQMRGAILVHFEDYEAALADVDKADELAPNDSFTLQIRGNIKRCVDDNEGALHDLEKANELEPNRSLTLSVMGAVKLNLGDYRGALMDLDRAAQIEPDDHFILTVRGNTKLHLEDYQGAMEDLDRALDKALERLSSSKSMSNAVLDKPVHGAQDPNRSFTLSIRGAVKLNTGDVQGALDDLDEADKLYPNDNFTLNLRATAKVLLGKYTGALEDLDHSCELDPDDTDVLRLRGNVKRLVGDSEGALRDLTRSNFMDPRNSYTLKFRGNVKRCLGDHRGALEDLNIANELKPDNPYTLLIRASIRGLLGDYEGALADLNHSLPEKTASAYGLLERGVAKYLTGDLEGAFLDLDRAYSIQPQNADILRHRGRVKFLLNDVAGAKADQFEAGSCEVLGRSVLTCLGHLPVESVLLSD